MGMTGKHAKPEEARIFFVVTMSIVDQVMDQARLDGAGKVPDCHCQGSSE